MAFKAASDKHRKFVVVGTGGGAGDRALLSPAHYKAMVGISAALMAYMREKLLATSPDNLEPLTLDSVGGVWADHVAVDLFNADPAGAPLSLRLPAEFKDGKFVDDGQNSPGAIANHFHRLFSHDCWQDGSRSLKAIDQAIQNGATIITAGREATHRLVAASDAAAMVAFTFGATPAPFFGLKPEAVPISNVGIKPGVAADSWRNCRAQAAKFHIPLQTILQAEDVITTKFSDRAKLMEQQRVPVAPVAQAVEDDPCPF